MGRKHFLLWFRYWLVVLLFVSHAQTLHAQDSNYVFKELISSQSGTKPNEFKFKFAGAAFIGHVNLPGPFFINSQGFIYIYETLHLDLKKFDQQGNYLREIFVEKQHRRWKAKTFEVDNDDNIYIMLEYTKMLKISLKHDNFEIVKIENPLKDEPTKGVSLWLNPDGTFIVTFRIEEYNDFEKLVRHENKSYKYNKNGDLLGEVEYLFEDSEGNVFNVERDKRRSARRRAFEEKPLLKYSGNRADQAPKLSKLSLSVSIDPDITPSKQSWKFIGFDKDTNIYIRIYYYRPQLDPAWPYITGSPRIHVLKYSPQGELLEDSKLEVPCTFRNAPAIRQVSIDNEGNIYADGIQPVYEWKWSENHYIQQAGLRYKLWKWERIR